jgi:apolipoprotein D and lipocalin family protein
MNFNNLKSIIMILSIFCFSCTKSQPLETVKNVDLNKYMGKWYEIALFPQSFEKGCNCTSAEYSFEKDYVRVLNSCNRDSANGKRTQAKGKAFVVKGSNNSKLKVQFFWPFKGDYWIIDLAEDYSYAVVGAPNRKYLWILCRKPVMDEKLYNDIVKRAAEKGFDISKLVKTNQECK